MFSVLIRRSSGLHQFVSRFIQGSLVSDINMGSSYSKSHSVSEYQNQALQARGSSTDTSCTGTVCKMNNPSEYVESVVCNVDDVKENEMKVFDIGEQGRVLIVKQNGEFNALGTKCTHYGAPLVNGALGNGRIRCPWHGACFNVNTGDIEDFPGFDSLPCYQVTVTEKGQVKVRAKISDLQTNKRIKEMRAVSPCEATGVVIVGGGPSGATCAETLRSEGFRGRITIVAREPCLPYDRIKVSKLTTPTTIDKLQARTPEYYQNNNIEILKGVKATKVDTNEKLVHLSNNTKLRYTALYIATGSTPNVLDIPGIHHKNVFTVRELEDSAKIMAAIGDNKDKNVVILGLSFIGLEMAAVCVDKAKSVTVIGRGEAPLDHAFGLEIGNRLKTLFEEKGVHFEFKSSIAACHGEDGAMKLVELEQGKLLHCDVLILGVGAHCATKFLRDSGITMQPNGAVVVNNRMETNITNVYAGGDIAYAPVYAAEGKQMNIGHIGLAQYHGRVAAMNIMKKDTPLHAVPYFWTTIFGKSIRYAGCGKVDSTQIVGNIDELKFVQFFFDEYEKVIAVASCMWDPVVSQFAELLYQGKTIHKKDLKEDPFAWVSLIKPDPNAGKKKSH